MIPSCVSHSLIQYTGSINELFPSLEYVKKIRITDSATQAILFDSEVKLHDKMEWSSDGYSEEFKYHFEKINDPNSRIFFVTDKSTKKIKIMSLNNTYQIPSYLLIEYKADERIKSNNKYEIEFFGWSGLRLI